MATDFVETVAGAIVGQLRQGTAPWTRPWAPGQHFLPYNPTTGNTYRGINSLWLLATSQERGYGDSRFDPIFAKMLNEQTPGCEQFAMACD